MHSSTTNYLFDYGAMLKNSLIEINSNYLEKDVESIYKKILSLLKSTSLI